MLLISCNTPEPEQQEKITAETCLNMLLAYYPYSLDENFVYVNETTGRKWDAKAYDRYKNEEYPRTSVTNNPSGYWDIEIMAEILENGGSPFADEMSYQSAYACCIARYIGRCAV